MTERTRRGQRQKRDRGWQTDRQTHRRNVCCCRFRKFCRVRQRVIRLLYKVPMLCYFPLDVHLFSSLAPCFAISPSPPGAPCGTPFPFPNLPFPSACPYCFCYKGTKFRVETAVHVKRVSLRALRGRLGRFQMRANNILRQSRRFGLCFRDGYWS